MIELLVVDEKKRPDRFEGDLGPDGEVREVEALAVPVHGDHALDLLMLVHEPHHIGESLALQPLHDFTLQAKEMTVRQARTI